MNFLDKFIKGQLQRGRTYLPTVSFGPFCGRSHTCNVIDHGPYYIRFDHFSNHTVFPSYVNLAEEKGYKNTTGLEHNRHPFCSWEGPRIMSLVLERGSDQKTYRSDGESSVIGLQVRNRQEPWNDGNLSVTNVA